MLFLYSCHIHEEEDLIPNGLNRITREEKSQANAIKNSLL
jgi:hypothetical protein